MGKNKLRITFDENCAGFILKALKDVVKNPRCTFCGDSITKKNFGGAIDKKFFCKNIICLVKLTENKVFKELDF
jgi:hypothetical protein